MLRMSSVLASLLLLVLSCATLHGQTQGEITGVVTDTTGAVVPGVNVTVTNTGTGAARQMQTNSSGVFDFPALLPGPYTLKADGKGFQPELQTGIELQVQQTIRADFHMKIGQSNETVTVSTATPLVSTEDVTVGTVIGTERITGLPLNGRDFLQLVSLSPNVVYNFAPSGQAVSVEGGQRAATTISIAGQRSEYNYYTLDGLDDTDDNFNTYLLLPSIDAIQEFKVQYGIYPAEYGRNVGQVNVSTLSGSNVYHGALWDFNRNSALAANNYDFTTAPTQKSPLNRNQFGFTLGGPVRIPKLFNGRNRLFFMTNYEGQRWYTSQQETGTVPTPAMLGEASGENYASFGPSHVYDPATETGSGSHVTATEFPNDQIPSSRFDKDAVYLLQFYPAPNVPGATINNYQALVSSVQNADQFTVRIDLTESAKSTWFGRYSWSSEFDLTPSTFPDQGSTLSTVVHQTAIGNTRTPTPTITNEFLVGYSGIVNGDLPQSAYSQNVIGSLPNGIVQGLAAPSPITYGIPSIGITGYSGFGDPQQLAISYDHTIQAVDNITMVRGKHTIQFGAEVRHDEYNQEGNSFVDGSLGFTGQATSNPQAPTTTGNPVADYMLGLTSVTAGAVLPLAVAQLRALDQFYYVEDTWRILPNLTITPGLRYENVPPFWSKHDELINTQVNSIPQTEAQLASWNGSNPPVVVRQGSANNFYAGLPWTFGAGITAVQDGRLGKYLTNRDNEMWAPRLGVAYNPTPKWAIRTGYGVFYAQDIGNAVYDMSRNRAVRRNATAANPYPNLTIENPFAVTPGSGLTITAPTILSNWVQRKSPYEIQWELNVQRQLTTTAAVEIGYNGSEGHHLDRFLNLNVPPLEAGNPQSNRPYPLLGPIQEVADYANADYNGLELKYTQRLSHGVNALVGYTYSRSIDNGSAIRSHSGDSDFPQNSYCKGGSIACGERGPSNFNQEQRLVTSLLYEPPIGRGKAFLNHGIASEVLGNWQFNEIFSLASGFPFTITESANLLNGGSGESSGQGGRPSYSGAPLFLPGEKTWHQWMNPAAFKNQPIYTFGNVSRNSIYGPGSLNWDSSIMKNFPVYREEQLQFRFEVFNAPNHPNFGLPAATFGNATFAQISSLASNGAMRQLQLSLKYVF